MHGVRTWALLAAAVFALAGCSQPASAPEAKPGGKDDAGNAVDEKPPVPSSVPDYTLTKDEEGMVAGFKARSVAASTNATTKEDLEAITRDLWANTDAEAIQVVFYPNEPMADSSGTGMGFADREAAHAIISAMYADPSVADVDGLVEEAMRNDGIYVISVEDEVDAAMHSVCADWDTTTMGTPPPECADY